MCNYFGEKAVKTVGNYNINKRDILEFQLKRIGKVIDNQVFIHNLMYLLKSLDKKIVFTNGCFDIVHSAHIKLIKYAKTLGKILVLGLNSDSSIKQLKGQKRPINTENERIEYLSELDRKSVV